MIKEYYTALSDYSASKKTGQEAEREIFESFDMITDALKTGVAGPVAAIVSIAVEQLIENEHVLREITDEVDMLEFDVTVRPDEFGFEAHVPTIQLPPDYHLQAAANPITALIEQGSMMDVARYYISAGSRLLGSDDDMNLWIYATDEKLQAMGASIWNSFLYSAEKEGIRLAIDEKTADIFDAYPHGYGDLSVLVARANVPLSRIGNISTEAINAVGELEAIMCVPETGPEDLLGLTSEYLEKGYFRSALNVEQILRGIDSSSFLFGLEPGNGYHPIQPRTNAPMPYAIVPAVDKPGSSCTPHDILGSCGLSYEELQRNLMFAGIIDIA